MNKAELERKVKSLESDLKLLQERADNHHEQIMQLTRLLLLSKVDSPIPASETWGLMP